jgi:hypothetical protein
LAKWEQGRAKPNPQAALVLLVRKYPDTLERLEKVAKQVSKDGDCKGEKTRGAAKKREADPSLRSG